MDDKTSWIDRPPRSPARTRRHPQGRLGYRHFRCPGGRGDHGACHAQHPTPHLDVATLDLALASARKKARCDYAQFLGAGPENTNWDSHPGLPDQAAGLKMYLDGTFGQLRLDDMTLWQEHFNTWPKGLPIVAHSESRSMAAVILMSAIYNRPVHIAHISLKEEILLIKAAKQRGIKVTCEVCPHHLFLTLDDIPAISQGHPGRGEVRPRLASRADVDALWANLEVIDCFATDHAPHTLAEKDHEDPPPGFPGLETLLPLMLTAVAEGRLTMDQIIEKSVINPRKIFSLPEQPETWVEVDEDATCEIKAAEMHSRCGWSPFEGRKVKGRVTRVILRGGVVFKDGRILAGLGSGMNVRPGCR
jgi:carbamoyl-phosphate synthase/aspartate carbamoyltransferase/dihydroorotase